MRALPLTCHPATPCAHLRTVSVHVSAEQPGVLRLRYRLEGDLQRLAWPAPRPSARRDELWRHTCFEAFVKRGAGLGYLELNFSPSSEWAAYGFDDYRQGMQPRALARVPEIACRTDSGARELDVTARIDDAFTERAPAAELRLALAAVIEDRDGQLSYWALAHPAERPDFHHADSFALSLPNWEVGE